VVEGDRFGVLQTFDDGWCVVAFEVPVQDGDEEAEIRMGCIPLWVFEFTGGDEVGEVGVRSMRSTSLAVTVEMLAAPTTVPGGPKRGGANDDMLEAPGKPWERANVISWSNF